jgi:ribosome-binding protein aMBF1 (putative translation factor)
MKVNMKIGICAMCGDQFPTSQTILLPDGFEVCRKCDEKGMERIKTAIRKRRKKLEQKGEVKP